MIYELPRYWHECPQLWGNMAALATAGKQLEIELFAAEMNKLCAEFDVTYDCKYNYDGIDHRFHYPSEEQFLLMVLKYS